MSADEDPNTRGANENLGLLARRILLSISARDHRVDVDFQEAESDKRPNLGQGAINREDVRLAMRVLQSLPKRDREVLTRFYQHEESAEEICRNMDLSEVEFRLIKSRAKARFGTLHKRCLASRGGTVAAGASLNQDLLAHAVDTFGSERKARTWLSSECGALNNQSPLEVIQRDGNEAEVERILDCIDYGMLA